MSKVTVFEVAAEAGVSLATVDRVLNRRPGVRTLTIERVQGAIERLGFRRDAFAAGLATRRRERYAFVLPAAGRSFFMDTLRDSLAALGAAMADQRVTISIIDYQPLDEASLCAALGGLMADVSEGGLDGVAVVAIDAPAVRHEIDRLVARGLGIVTLVSDVSPSRRRHFVGIDNTAAGRVAASLIGRMARPAVGPVGVIVGQMTLHDHADRRLGFEQVIRREFPSLRLLEVLEGRDDSATAEALTRGLLARHPELVGLYSAGAGNRGIIAALADVPPARRPIVVAHELSPYVRDALLSGVITAVLHQNQAHEAAEALAAMRAAAGFAVPSAGGARPIPTEIFLRDNVP